MKHGRKGKGSIYVWAAGNGRHNGDSCAFDGYAGSPYVNAIGAEDYDGRQSWYSEGCSNLLAVTPSSGSSSPGSGIVTADLLGPAGYDPSECTSTFGGTSSAAPLAAGIIALMLEQRPELTWRDVRHIIARAARQPQNDKRSINEETNNNNTKRRYNNDKQTNDKRQNKQNVGRNNNGNFIHTNEFGFGTLRIPAIMAVLRNYTQVPPEQKQHLTPQLLPEGHIVPIPAAINVPINATFQFVENVILRISLKHPRRGDLTISITSAVTGLTSVLASPRPNDDNADYDEWTFSSLKHWGDTIAIGDVWTINVSDSLSNNGRRVVTSAMIGIFGF